MGKLHLDEDSDTLDALVKLSVGLRSVGFDSVHQPSEGLVFTRLHY